MNQPTSRGEQLSFANDDHGVSVSLAERKLAIDALAAMYGEYARARGLRTVQKTVAGHTKLKERYGKNTESVVEGATLRATVDLRKEAEYVEPLMKSDELIAAGFDPTDVETDKLRTTIELRHVVGERVGAPARKKVLDTIYAPAGAGNKMEPYQVI